MNGKRNGIDAELFERMEQSGKLLHEFEKLNDDMNRFYWEYTKSIAALEKQLDHGGFPSDYAIKLYDMLYEDRRVITKLNDLLNDLYRAVIQGHGELMDIVYPDLKHLLE